MTFEVTKASQLSPQSASLTVLAGPPGLGKSTTAGTVAEWIGDPSQVLVVATLPREVDSLMYQKHDLDTVVVTDEDWSPEDKTLKATGYQTLRRILRELRTDEIYSALILDNGTEMAEQAWHAAMAPLGVGDPNDLGRGSNRFAPYTSLREKMEQLINSLATLTGKSGKVVRPKTVIIPWHVQPPKDSSDDDESADERGQGSEYEGTFLPMIRGAYRRRLMGQVDNFLYADLVTVPKNPKNPLAGSDNHFCLQVISDHERHCKLAGVTPDPEKLVKGKYLDVHNRDDAWRMLMDLIDHNQQAGAKK